jgi:hypothetical protein
MSRPSGSDFWVIVANFLGDRSLDVRRAMVHNLAHGVTYTYFLHTHADVLRLGLLRDELQRELARGDGSDDPQRMGERVRCVLLPRELNTDDRLCRLLRADYFLCPHDPDMGGYRLTSSGLSAERMSADDYRELVDALDPLISSRIRGLFMSSAESWARQSSHFAVVCTELEPREVHQDHDPWLRMLASYDRILAREVSMHADDCVVVRPVRNGYLLAFQRPRDAAAWARRLQFEVDWYNDQVARNASSDIPIPTHSIALGYGLVSRVLRAHGYDHVGAVIDDCIDLPLGSPKAAS